MLVNNGAGNINTDADGFTLADGQSIVSFANGASVSLGAPPANVTGTNVIAGTQFQADPFGNGGATLNNSAGNAIDLANGNLVANLTVSSSATAIDGTGIAGATINGVTVSSAATGLVLDGVTGTVTVGGLNVQNASQTGIALVGSSAMVNFTGNTKIANATNVGLFANNFDGTASFDDLDVTGGGTGVGIVAGSSGTMTFGTGSSIAGTISNAFSITNSTPNVTYNGTISQTAAASAVRISNMTGGTATFGGKITASTGAANAIDLTGNTGGTVNFNGGLDLTADGGFAFSAVGGGTLTVTGSSNTVATGLGPDEKGIQIAGMTIGAAGVNFSSVAVDGSGGGVSTGIAISNTSGGNVTFGGVDLYRISGVAISLNNVSGTYSFNGTTKVDTVVGGGAGFLVQNSAATVNVGNLVTTNIAGADVSLANNTGTIGIGGTITNSGSGDGVVVSGGSAAITMSAAISSSATAPGTAVKVDGITGGSVAFSGAVNSTGTGTGVSVSNTAGGSSVGFGSVTVSGAAGNGIDISGNAGSVTFAGTTGVTLGSAANAAGINFSGTNANVTFGATNVTMGAGAGQTGIDFTGSSTTAGFGVTTITGTGILTSRGIDLSSTTGNKTITFQRGSSITNLGIGVELAHDLTTATSANANFTFGDGNSADGLQSTISATAVGAYTVNTVGLNPASGNYDFDDVFFTGNANLASAVGVVTFVSQSGGVIAAGTDGLSMSVNTISVAAADALAGTQTFAFVGTVDLSGTPFTLDSGQSITGFGNNSSILVSGTIQPVNVQGNLGATGGNVTGNEGVVTGTGGLLNLLGNNQVRNTAFDFSGAIGSVFTIDQNAGGFNNAGGIVIEGVTVSNVASGSLAFNVTSLDTNLSIANNNINVAGTLLKVTAGTGNITLTRGILPNSATAGTLTGGGVNIDSRTGGLVNFTDKVTVNGNGVSLTNNTGSTVTFADVDITTNGAAAFTATGGGAVNVTTGTINATNAQAVALDGITAGINFASTSATFASGNGIDLQKLSGTASFGTGTLTNTGLGTSFNVGSATALSGGNATISYGGTIATNGAGAAVSIQSMTGGSVTLSGNLADSNATAGGNIVVAAIDNGTAATVTFSGATKQISSGATDGVSLTGNPNGTIDFGNGGLAITTTTATGFHVAAAGTVSVTGSGNTITTTAGTALDLANATVGAGGVTFDSISVNGAATGVSLNNVSGGALGLGVVNLQNITSRGIDISGTLGAAVNATSLNIGLNAASAVGLDLNGAALGASNITAGDFDVDGGSFAGTIGIDMAGTTGTGTIQLGDTVNNNPGPAGQTSTIANVGYGVQFSSATNAKLVFGDGQGPAESSIATTGGQVIHATDTLPTNGDYNFNDVNFTGDTANLASISVYYVTAGGTGDGSLANPGSYLGAQASTANVVVLIDQNVNGAQETIDLSGTTFNLDDGQVLLAFKSGDAAVDVSTLGVDTSGGASAAFHFTTVQNSPIIAAPGGIDTLRPILQSNNATSVINFATSGTGTFTGGIENLIVRNLGSGAGVAVNAAGASNFILRNNDIAAGGNALNFATTGAPANTLLLSIDGNTLRSTASGLAASFSGQNISATDNSIAIRSFAGNKVTGGAGSGGIVFNNVRFDSDGAGGTVSAGTLAMGNPGARIQGNGLSFTNTSGTLDLGQLNLANTGGTGVLANTKGAGTIFTLNSSAGVVATNSGAAFNLDPLTVNMTFSSVSASSGASGIIFDGVAGTFTVTGATSISSTTGFGIDAINTNTGTFNFNTVTVNNAAAAGGGIHVASGTLNVTGLANIDTTSGIGLSQNGGTTSFTGGLTIDTTTGIGIFGNGGTIGITATAGAETVNSTLGQAIDLGSMQANIALDSTSSGGGGDNVSLVLVDGALNLGSGTLTGATSSSFNVNGGTAAVSYSGDITKSSGSGAAVIVQGRFAGAGLVALSGNLTSNVNGIVLSANSGGTVTVSGASNNFTGAGFGIAITGNSGGTYNINGASYTIGMTGGGTGVNISGNSSPVTMNFGGGLAITTAAGAGFSATGVGTLNVTGSSNTISTGSGTALSLNGLTVGAGGVNFSSVSANGAATGISLTNVISSGGGTIALGTVNLQNITSRGVDVTGTLGVALSFNDLDIGLNSSTGVAFDLNGAAINAAITANDFDVTNAAAAGTSIGVDLQGASGGQTVRLGDTVVGGNSSSIAGVNTGVLLNSTTNLAFVYGDGESATDQLSTISANVGIDASSAPVAGTYNFQDVNFQSSPGLGFGIGKIYFVGASATGDGTGRDQNNLATLSTAEAASVASDILVLVNDQGVITAQGTNGNDTLVLLASEQVRGFDNGNINLALTVPSTVQLASNTLSIADQTPGGTTTLTTTDGSTAITLGASGNIIDGFTINGDDGTGANAAIGIGGSGTANATIRNMTIRNVTAADIDFGAGATGTTTLTNLSLVGGAAATGIKFGAATGTVTATNVDTTGASGLSVVGGNAAFSFDSASSVTSVAGTAVSITNRSGGSFGFAGTVASNIGASGIVISGATGVNTVSFTGTVNHNGGSGTAVSIDNGGFASTVSFASLAITTGAANTAFTATNGGTVTVTTGSISATVAQAVNLNGIAAGINFASTTSGGGVNNVALTNVTGTVNLGGGALSGASGTAFLVSGGSANIDYNGSITHTANATAITVQNHTGTAGGASTISFDGTVSSSGSSDGINLVSNGGTNGTNINFTNTLTINTSISGSTGFNATGGGTVTATGGTGSTITSGTGTALNVANTTIGASGLTFRSVSSNGAANGIVLNNTGTSGGLTVTGDGGGANNGSGGTIQNSTGDGISLTSTQDVHLAYMNITNNLGDGIGGSGINGFVLNRLNISGNGNDAATDESGINITQLTGTASNGAHATSISNSVISNNNEFEIQIANSSGTLTNLQFINNTISSNGLPINGNVGSPHGNLVNFLGTGSSTMGITVTGGSFTGDWNAASPPATITGTGLFANSGGTSMTVNVSGATFTNNNAGVDVSTDPAATSLTFDIESNTFIGQRSTAINHFDNGNGPFNRTVNGTIKNNIIGNNAVTNSGSSVGTGIQIQNEGAVNGKYLIDGNQIYQIATGPGISVNVGLAGQATGGGETDLTITNNIFDHINGSRAITVQDNQVTNIASPPGAGPFPTIWLNLQGNSFANIAGQAGNGQYVRLKQSYGVFKVTQSAATAGANAGELDDANGINDPTKFSTSSTSGSIQYGQGAAPLPTTNPLP